MEVRPLARKGACPSSLGALKLPRQYDDEGCGLQPSNVEENWTCHGSGGGIVPILQMRKQRLREICNWPYTKGRVQLLRPAGIWDSVPTALQIKKLKCKMHFPARTPFSPSPKPTHSDSGLAVWAQEEPGPHQASLSWLSHRWSTKGGKPCRERARQARSRLRGRLPPRFLPLSALCYAPFQLSRQSLGVPS